MPAPTTPDLLKNVRRLEVVYPAFRRHREALSLLGSQVVYATCISNNKGAESGLALVRFSGAIESAFGMTREVLFYYTPHRDLQFRDFKGARVALRSLNREVTPDLIFMCSEDERLDIKLDDWSKLEFTAIPLSPHLDEDPLSVISLIRDHIFARDLFYETSPVKGNRFFGRKTLLQSLRDDLNHQRVPALFGLRKSGKTSVLYQLAEELETPSTVTVLIDLESLPSPPDDPTPDLIADLKTKLQLQLKAKKQRTREIAELGNQPSIVEFKNALQGLLHRLSDDDVQVVLMLDEIEYLTPSDRVDIEEGDMPRIAQLLGALRSLVQENDNFTFMLSGLTSAITESGRLYGRPNPLFSWAKTHYLAPLLPEEADELARSTGGRMGIELTDGALESLYEASGGHAYLYRNFASFVVSSLPLDVYRRRIERSDVLRQSIPWRRSIAGNIEEMLAHLERYYPVEHILLDILRESPQDFAEISRAEERAFNHLIQLGLVMEENNEIQLNTILQIS
ncbi:ATP-binding protein [Ornithinimicrobium sp. Arc0846-15]|nr:ATP-binding protein [Ornithinimicrobium laminariae]